MSNCRKCKYYEELGPFCGYVESNCKIRGSLEGDCFNSNPNNLYLVGEEECDDFEEVK